MTETATPVTGTIFDTDLPRAETDPVRHQRICGMFFLRDINPGAVVGDSYRLEPTEDPDQFILHFATVYLPPGQSQWSWGNEAARDADRAPIPGPVFCEHGPDTHRVIRRRSFAVSWTEVAR